MKITVLIENTAPEYLKCEHGLSIYIASVSYTHLTLPR